MRLSIACVVLSMQVLALKAETLQPEKGKRATVATMAGIKTPGIQIPFANLKPEAEVPLADPQSLGFAQQVFAGGKELHRVDIKTNKPMDPVAGIKKPCGGFASGFGDLWTGDCGAGTLVRIDTKAVKVKSTLDIPVEAIAASDDSIWVLADAKTTLARIDPLENKTVAEVRLPEGCNSMAFGETALWVTCPKENVVLRIDPRTNLVVNRIEVAEGPLALAIGEGSVWVLCGKEGKVARIDPKTNKPSGTIELKTPGAKGTIATGLGGVWVSMPGFPITRIEPQTDKVAQQFTGGSGGTIYIAAGSVWLTVSNGVSRFDAKRIKATLAE